MFVYVWVSLGFFLSLLTSSYDAINMFFSCGLSLGCTRCHSRCIQILREYIIALLTSMFTFVLLVV